MSQLPNRASSRSATQPNSQDMSTTLNGTFGSHRQTSGGSDNSPVQSPSSNRSDSPGQSAAKKRLSEEEKKKNHINSEQKRREAIRRGFDDLTQLVPGTEGQARSENIVLEATIGFLDQQIQERRRLIALANEHGVSTHDFQIPDGIGFQNRNRSQIDD